MRADGLPDILYGKNGIHCMRPWNKIFSLQFFTAAGSKTHFKMRQSLVPGPGHTQLLCTIFSRKRYDGMQIFYGGFGAKKILWCSRGCVIAHLAFDPYFIDVISRPISKKTDAVTCTHDS